MSDSVSGIDPLDRRINKWAAMISDCSGSTLAGILLSAENVFHAVRDLSSYGPEVRRTLQARARLSQPMMSKLEAIGRHAALFRLQADNLPPSVSSLYALAQRPGHEMIRAIATDLRDKTRAEIKGAVRPGASGKDHATADDHRGPGRCRERNEAPADRGHQVGPRQDRRGAENRPVDPITTHRQAENRAPGPSADTRYGGGHRQ